MSLDLIVFGAGHGLITGTQLAQLRSTSSPEGGPNFAKGSVHTTPSCPNLQGVSSTPVSQRDLVQAHRAGAGHTLLCVACGTTNSACEDALLAPFKKWVEHVEWLISFERWRSEDLSGVTRTRERSHLGVGLFLTAYAGEMTLPKIEEDDQVGAAIAALFQVAAEELSDHGGVSVAAKCARSVRRWVGPSTTWVSLGLRPKDLADSDNPQMEARLAALVSSTEPLTVSGLPYAPRVFAKLTYEAQGLGFTPADGARTSRGGELAHAAQ